MKKIIVIVLIVLLAAWLGLSYYTQHQAKEIPSVAEAPYLVQTFTRIYYAKEVSGVSPDVTMKGFYEWNENQWQYHRTGLTFNKNTGEVRVTDRRVIK